MGDSRQPWQLRVSGSSCRGLLLLAVPGGARQAACVNSSGARVRVLLGPQGDAGPRTCAPPLQYAAGAAARPAPAGLTGGISACHAPAAGPGGASCGGGGAGGGVGGPHDQGVQGAGRASTPTTGGACIDSAVPTSRLPGWHGSHTFPPGAAAGPLPGPAPPPRQEPGPAHVSEHWTAPAACCAPAAPHAAAALRCQ
jgi:hypothetical protein